MSSENILSCLDESQLKVLHWNSGIGAPPEIRLAERALLYEQESAAFKNIFREMKEYATLPTAAYWVAPSIYIYMRRWQACFF